MFLFAFLLNLVSGSHQPVDFACPSAEVPAWVATASPQLNDFCQFKQWALPGYVVAEHSPISSSDQNLQALRAYVDAFQALPRSQRIGPLSMAAQFLHEMDLTYASSLMDRLQAEFEFNALTDLASAYREALMPIHSQQLPFVDNQIALLTGEISALEAQIEEPQELVQNLPVVLETIARYANGPVSRKQIAFIAPEYISEFQGRALRVASAYIEGRNYTELIRYIRLIASQYRPKVLEIILTKVRKFVDEMHQTKLSNLLASMERHTVLRNALEVRLRGKERLEMQQAALMAPLQTLLPILARKQRTLAETESTY